MKQALDLIDQLIQMEEAREIEHKELMTKIGKSCRTVGDSSMLFHLKALRELIVDQASIPMVFGCFRSPFSSPPMPAWADKLPSPLHVGMRAKIVGDHSWSGKQGKIVSHYINGDDCGDWGKEYYTILCDGEHYPVRREYCQLIDAIDAQELEEPHIPINLFYQDFIKK